MKIKDLLNQNKQKLQGFSPTPDLDAEILLSSILKKDREFLFSHSEQKVLSKKIEDFETLIQKRIQQTPIAYLTKEKSFYGRSFSVNQATLIPRPETELLVEKTLEYCHKEFYPSQKITLIDIGTGSGCILISLLKEFQKSLFKNSDIKALGTDISSEALKIAKKNWGKLVPEIKINFLKADLLDFLDKRYLEYLKNTQLVITANLPYLSQNIYKNCPKSVLKFEPKKALIAKERGLEFYLKLLKQIQKNHLLDLVQNLYLIFEISPEQEKFAKKEFLKIFPDAKIKFSKDFAQKWRFIEIIL